MFGYIVTNNEILNKDGKKIYRSSYCGLCHCLNERYGLLGRRYLTYDFTFIAMLLSSIYEKNDTVIKETCLLHPVINHEAQFNDLYDYAARMNMYLYYHKLVDDLHDTGKQKYAKQLEKFEFIVKECEKQYPNKTNFIKDKLNQISQFEKENVLNADLPANAFGEIMGELFIIQEDQYSSDLRQFGYHLGRFIYLLDAVIDLKHDIKKQNYNPLIRVKREDFLDILLMVMEEVDVAYKKLPLKRNKEIFDNIIYSGIWSGYQLYTKRQELFK